jgi:hypothetical protein
MNITDNIYYLAQQNGRRCFPRSFQDDVYENLPYIHVTRDLLDGWKTEAYNYEHHDNAPRMDYYCNYLEQYIFPNVSGDLEGYYNIELHDSYTYLNNSKRYDDVLTFSKLKLDVGPVLIPDPYMLANWGDAEVTDKRKWESKDDICCFYGTTTGSRDPLNNRRINMCLWAVDKPEYDFAITKVAQMFPRDIITCTGIDNWKKLYKPSSVSLDEQLRHKFLFMPDGNTCKFDVWNYHTNSLTFKDKSEDMMWYYPMLVDKQHYVEVDEFNMENMRQYYINNPKEAKLITKTANKLAKELFRPCSHMLYTTVLFETIASNNK